MHNIFRGQKGNNIKKGKKRKRKKGKRTKETKEKQYIQPLKHHPTWRIGATPTRNIIIRAKSTSNDQQGWTPLPKGQEGEGRYNKQTTTPTK